MEVLGHFIAGRTERASGATAPVYDPATGVVAAEVRLGDAAAVDRAVASASAAFESWSQSSISERTTVMFSFWRLLMERRHQLAQRIVSENGKTLDDAIGEIDRGIQNVEFACGVGSLLRGEYSQSASRGVDVRSIRQPLGVVVGITPFNFPAMVPLWMFPLAIACGNTFVLKPSEKVPSASLLLADMLSDAGLPPGVFNVLNGDRDTARLLLDHPDVAAVSFVGSTPAAESVQQSAVRSGKRVQALGGAKNHMVVMPDADLDAAATAAVSAAFGAAGERCMAVSVVVAVDPTGDDLVAAIADRMASLRIGPGTDPSADIGPLITREHRTRVAGYLEPASIGAGKVVVDGRSTSVPSEGFFLAPSLVDRVEPGSRVYRDEIFGPILSVVRVPNLDEALRLVNSSTYGNGATIFTSSGRSARRFEVECCAGMIGVNVAIPVPVAYHSFGGWRSSLFGDTGIYGPEGMRFYTRAKVVTSRWPDSTPGRASLAFPSEHH